MGPWEEQGRLSFGIPVSIFPEFCQHLRRPLLRLSSFLTTPGGHFITEVGSHALQGPQTQYVLEDDLRTPDLPASAAPTLGLQVSATTPRLHNAGDSTQGFVHDRQALSQLSSVSAQDL